MNGVITRLISIRNYLTKKAKQYLLDYKFNRRIARYSRAIELDSHYNRYHLRGFVYYQNGDYDNAIADYSKAIEIFPQDNDSYHMRGNVYSHLGIFDQAISDYSQAIELKPFDFMAYDSRGRLYAKLGFHERAVADLDKSIEYLPQGGAHIARAESLSIMGDKQRAISDLETVLEMGIHLPQEQQERVEKLLDEMSQ